jgi:DNA-binding HxlR family transcriptional regulator
MCQAARAEGRTVDTVSDAFSRREFLASAAAALAWRACGGWTGCCTPASMDRMDRVERLITLFRRRWACPVLAQLHRAEGAKFVTLVNRLGSNQGAIRLTLDTLIDLDWVRRNPGYGHPMRPEYILTAKGERLAPACARLDDALTYLGLRAAALRKWSMPVLYVVGEGPTRFSQIPRVLRDATDRAVSLTLKELSIADMVTRSVIEGPPSGTAYGATYRGGVLLPILEQV